MKLPEAAACYVAHKQAMGMRFRTEARTLRSFCQAMGDVSMQDVSASAVATFLAGAGPVTRFWERKHNVLQGFYRFAIARGYAEHSVLPNRIPKPSQTFVPYIYSREELRRQLDAIPLIDHPRNTIDPETYRAILLLLVSYVDGPPWSTVERGYAVTRGPTLPRKPRERGFNCAPSPLRTRFASGYLSLPLRF